MSDPRRRLEDLIAQDLRQQAAAQESTRQLREQRAKADAANMAQKRVLQASLAELIASDITAFVGLLNERNVRPTATLLGQTVMQKVTRANTGLSRLFLGPDRKEMKEVVEADVCVWPITQQRRSRTHDQPLARAENTTIQVVSYKGLAADPDATVWKYSAETATQIVGYAGSYDWTDVPLGSTEGQYNSEGKADTNALVPLDGIRPMDWINPSGDDLDELELMRRQPVVSTLEANLRRIAVDLLS